MALAGWALEAPDQPLDALCRRFKPFDEPLLGPIHTCARLLLGVAHVPQLVFGLGIRHVGERTASILARNFRTLAGLGDASVEELDAVPEIGLTVAESVHDWFADAGNLALCERLRERGVRTEMESAGAGGGVQTEAFAGMLFVLKTGIPWEMLPQEMGCGCGMPCGRRLRNW